MKNRARWVVSIGLISALAASVHALPLLDQKHLISAPHGAGAARPGMESTPSSLVDPTARNHVVSSRVGADIFSGLNINTFLGADRFYKAGFTGTNSVMANVEAGLIWSGHETLGHATTQIFHTGPFSGPQTGEVDRHATWVGGMMGGRPGGAVQGEWQPGIAPDAQLWSGAIATEWLNDRYAVGFGFNPVTFAEPYDTVFAAGIGGRTADVVNSSWGFDEPTGSNLFTLTADALSADNPLTTLVVSAGNSGLGSNTVGGLAAGHNVIAAAALGTDTDTPPFETVSAFSSGGLNDYQDPVNGLFRNARVAVDLAGPGENLTLPYYGGETGGNSPLLGGGPSGPPGGPNFYSGDLAGTSFAAPIIAGGAALLTDAAYSAFPENTNARDARVIKAALLNSADKLPGWDNGQRLFDSVLATFQSLDVASGAGRMNLNRAFEQYLLGMADLPGFGGGVVDVLGWDFGRTQAGAPTDYFFDVPLKSGTSLTVTLDWFRDRSVFQFPFDLGFADLDLEVWEVVDESPSRLVATSLSTFNNVEHLSFLVPNDGHYMLRARYFQEVFDLVGDDNATFYGIAWAGTSAAVAEPASLALVALGSAMLIWVRRARPGKAVA